MKTAILQSNYIPWIGYFHLIHLVDTFVIYDSVQYTKNDWRNRNRLIINGATTWLTIPVHQEELRQSIEETRVSNPIWAKKHWKTIQQAYAKAPYFGQFSESFSKLYASFGSMSLLSNINRSAIQYICEILDINTTIRSDDEFGLPDDRLDRLITICRETGADTYLTGPAAKNYIDEKKFEQNGLNIEWMDYSKYRPYNQLSPDFDLYVSVLDFLFCHGPGFREYIGE